MSIKGRRTIKLSEEEPTLLGNIDVIVSEAKRKGYIKNNEVDIESIVKEQGIEIRREELPNSRSGMLKQINGKWVIGINKDHSITRQRFTIAHEFAHYILHRLDGTYFEDVTFFRESNDSPSEYQANAFAAQLLMPEESFNFVVNKTKKIKDLADLFNVSVQALKFRAKELGYNIKSN